MFKCNNKDTTMTSMTSYWGVYWPYFTLFCNVVSIVEFEQVFVCCGTVIRNELTIFRGKKNYCFLKHTLSRSTPAQLFCEKAFRKTLAKITGKHLRWWSLFKWLHIKQTPLQLFLYALREIFQSIFPLEFLPATSKLTTETLAKVVKCIQS